MAVLKTKEQLLEVVPGYFLTESKFSGENFEKVGLSKFKSDIVRFMSFVVSGAVINKFDYVLVGQFTKWVNLILAAVFDAPRKALFHHLDGNLVATLLVKGQFDLASRATGVNGAFKSVFVSKWLHFQSFDLIC